MGKKESSSIRSKAAHFVADLTTVYFNPISDHKPINPTPLHPPPEDETESETSPPKPIAEEGSLDSAKGPDTSSFTAFLYSLLAPSESGITLNLDEKNENREEMSEPVANRTLKGSSGKKSVFSRGKQTLGRALNQAVRFGYRNQASEHKVNTGTDAKADEDVGVAMQTFDEPVALEDLPKISESSLLLSEKARTSLYLALPVLVQGRNWVLLYSTWRHGISLSTLYRRSLLCPGLTLLVVGDHKGAVFGGLVEAPLRPTSQKKYQGTNESFVFTSLSGNPVIFRPTGINRYFTLCSIDSLALGGGSHFALYLDGDLLNGSSAASETYGNPCLACSEDFGVKEIELWGFVYPSKYEEAVSMLRMEAPGICRW